MYLLTVILSERAPNITEYFTIMPPIGLLLGGVDFSNFLVTLITLKESMGDVPAPLKQETLLTEIRNLLKSGS